MILVLRGLVRRRSRWWMMDGLHDGHGHEHEHTLFMTGKVDAWSVDEHER